MNAKTSRMRANIANRKLAIDKAAATGDATKTEQTFRKNATNWVDGLLNVDKRTGLPRTPISKQALINGIMSNFGQPLFAQYGRKAVLAWANAVVNSFPNSYWSGKKKTSKSTGGATGGKKPVDDLG